MISEIKDLISALRDLSTIAGRKNDVGGVVKDLNRPGSSIKRKAKDSILQFPVLISSGLNKDTLTTIVKALEHENAVFVKMAIGLNDVVDVRNGQSKTAFLSKFHTNVNFNRSIDSFVKENAEMLNIELLAPYDGGLNEATLNDLTIKNVRFFNEEEGRQQSPVQGDDAETSKDPLKKAKDNAREKIATDRMLSAYQRGRNKENLGDANVRKGPTFVDADVKKANDLLPTMMELEVEYLPPNGGDLKTTTITIGIKCVAHPIQPSEIVHFLGRSLKENSPMFRVIQWTTGEIKFMKDFILNVDRVKDETATQSNRSGKYWAKLRSLATANKFRKAFKKDEIIPTSTMVISMDEVETLKNTQGIDLLNDKAMVNKLIKVYFLMGFVIMDDIDEVAYIFDEENSEFRHYSYSSLKKEKSDKNDLKTILSLVGGNR